MGKVRGGTALLGVAVAFAIALSCAPGIEAGQLKCEEAVSHLASCCPDFDPATVDCGSDRVGCGYTSYVRGPRLSAELADCLAESSCEDLLSSGTCDAARQVDPSTQRQFAGVQCR